MKNQIRGVWAGFNGPMLLAIGVLVCSACGALSNDERPVLQVRYTQSGELVVLADRVLSVFDGELKRERLSFDLGPGYATQEPWSLGVSNDGTVAAAALNDSVAIFDLKMGKKLRTLSASDLAVPSELPRLNVNTLALSPDGQFLAVTTQQSNDEVARLDPSLFKQEQWLLLYRVATGERLWKIGSIPNTVPSPGVPQTFAPPLFSADGQLLFVRIWLQTDYMQLETQTGVARGPFVFTGAAFNLFCPSFDHSHVSGYSVNSDLPERRFVPSVWSAVDGSLLHSFPTVNADCPVTVTAGLWIDESPNHQVFASGEFSKCSNGSPSEVEAVVWNAEGNVLFRFPEPSFFALTFSPDSANLAVAGGREGVSVYRLSDGKKLGNHKFDRKVF